MRRLTVILCFALIAAFLIPLTGCLPAPDPSNPATQPSTPTQPSEPIDLTLDWTMHSWVINLKGQVATEMDISVTGNIYTADGKTYLPLDIMTPAPFEFFYEKPNQGTPISISGSTDGLPYYVWMGYGFNRIVSQSTFGRYALCLEKEWLIVNWGDRYLLASRDPNANPAEILAYFQGFIDIYCQEAPTAPTEPTTPTQPTEPMPEITDTQQLIATVYVTQVDAIYGRILTPTPAELELTITWYADGQESVSLDMAHVKNQFSDKLDFQDERNRFTLQQPDPELPIYFIAAEIYRENSRSYDRIDFFINFETKTLLFRPIAVPVYYYSVASTDPAVHPCDIVESFLPYLEQLFPPWKDMEETMYPIPQRTEQHFYYELTGTWRDTDGQPLEQMDFRLVGNLTPDGGFNDDVERNLLFLWPESFGYENAEPVSESITLTVQEAGPNYHGIGLLRDTKTDELVTFSFNIFPEDEIVILEMDGKFLVSSTRSDLDASTILSQYQERLISHNAQAVDWEMTAYMLKADGTIIDTYTMTITGYIWVYSERYSYLVLDIDLPEGFRYATSIPGPYGDIFYRRSLIDSNDYLGSSLSFDGVLNTICDYYMGINTEKEYYVSNWEQGSVRYLVAATDPNVTADQILGHFWDYLELNGYTD